MSDDRFEVVVVGGGHAGVEAAHASARLGVSTALITLDKKTIAQMSCNPAIGGLAKGQIVREIDALGGLMARAIDIAGIQFRLLNRSKGPAVWGPRAQADKWFYQDVIRQLLADCENLQIIEDEVVDLILENKKITGIICTSGKTISAQIVIFTTGTFLDGLMHIGPEQKIGGRINEPAASGLSAALTRAGLKRERLKTGTPPRVDINSIDLDRLEVQHGDADPVPFSFLNDRIDCEQVGCWITYTNDHTHKIITGNLDQAPLYTGQIKSTGPRYCPSIETKVVRFADKKRHQIFLEPEGRNSNWIYCNGISTSLPRDIQQQMVHSIVGLEKAEFLQYGYAIEYDYIPPTQIRPTLECKKIEGLFLAGQINGTSGYEEAAGQGLIAGVNAARMNRAMEPVFLHRDQAYIGVMIDDIVTKGVDEPYRMFTSRAEYRLLLRSDNADQRLTAVGKNWSLVDDNRWKIFQNKHRQAQEIKNYLDQRSIDGKKMTQLLRQQNRDEKWLLDTDTQIAQKKYNYWAIQQVVNDIRYSGYVEKQLRLIERFKKAEDVKLPQNFDYSDISQLRIEARQRLNQVQPITLGQASRILGINPADITVLMIHMQKMGEFPNK
ncbi:MAG: tRNA uridine-5-carboxymethylaminomethyl(34) synthesis enzyme MnmG [Planctomycetes bacterium]|nr:tRNA uridine-5-carboxymethylaminomethyl(34) synthesis enzyme MnmG [Planctomycetota bacterium]